MNSEKEMLNKIAANSLYTTFSNTMMIEYCFKVFKRFIKPGKTLEMGPAEGVMTKFLSSYCTNLTLLEGSEVFSKQLETEYPHCKVVNTLFEEFVPDGKFDTIILGHVLEHVDDPIAILKQVKSWLNEDGIVLAAVPNSRSLHRQAAVIMNFLKTEDSMSELDIHHGHRRIYNPEMFRSHFTEAGFKIDFFGGYWLKPLSNAQIHETWTREMLEAFMSLGERYPDIAAEIYVVAK